MLCFVRHGWQCCVCNAVTTSCYAAPLVISLLDDALSWSAVRCVCQLDTCAVTANAGWVPIMTRQRHGVLCRLHDSGAMSVAYLGSCTFGTLPQQLLHFGAVSPALPQFHWTNYSTNYSTTFGSTYKGVNSLQGLRSSGIACISSMPQAFHKPAAMQSLSHE